MTANPLSASIGDLYTMGARLGDASHKSSMSFRRCTRRCQTTRRHTWGDDPIGNSFADGPNGYLAQMDWVFRAIGGKTDLLDGYSGFMTDSAKNFNQQDNSWPDPPSKALTGREKRHGH